MVSPSNERALVASLIPPSSICADKVPTITFHRHPIKFYSPEPELDWAYCLWLAVANSFAMDFIVRKKVSLKMSYTVMDSLPFPRLQPGDARVAKLMPIVLRLECTGPEMADYWNAMASIAAVTKCEPIQHRRDLSMLRSGSTLVLKLRRSSLAMSSD